MQKSLGWIFLGLLLGPLAVGAAKPQYKVSGKLYVDGKMVSNSSVLTSEGTQASTSMNKKGAAEEIVLKVLPIRTMHSKVDPKIFMQVELTYLQEGRLITASRHVTAQEGKESIINLGSPQGGQKIELRLTAAPQG